MRLEGTNYTHQRKRNCTRFADASFLCQKLETYFSSTMMHTPDSVSRRHVAVGTRHGCDDFLLLWRGNLKKKYPPIFTNAQVCPSHSREFGLGEAGSIAANKVQR